MVILILNGLSFNFCYLKLDLLDFFKVLSLAKIRLFHSFLIFILTLAQLYIINTILSKSKQLNIEHKFVNKHSQLPYLIHKNLLK